MHPLIQEKSSSFSSMEDSFEEVVKIDAKEISTK